MSSPTMSSDDTEEVVVLKRVHIVSQIPIPLALLEILVIGGLFYGLFKFLSQALTSPAFIKAWKINSATAVDVACKMVSAVFAIMASSTGVYLMATASPESEVDLIRQPHPMLEHILMVAIAYFFYDLVAMYKVYQLQAKAGDQSFGSNPDQNSNGIAKKVSHHQSSISPLSFFKARPLIVLHHVAIGGIFTPMMMTCLDHDPGELMIACALIFEASTPFVSMRAILANLNLRHSLLYTINGVAMVLVFFLCRIMVYPIFYYAYATKRNLSYWTAIVRSPFKCLFIQVVILLPQLYWFYVMLKGAIKVVQEKRELPEDKTK